MSVGVGLTARMQQAIKEGRPLYLLAAIDHPDGFVYLWSGTGDLVWDGNTYVGRGALGSLGQIEESSELEIGQRVMTLKGVDPEATQFLAANVRNRTATFWLACLDRQGKVIRDPYLLEEVLMDGQSLPVDEQGRVSVQITAYSGFWNLERAQDIAWSTEEAKLDYPDETGFDMIPSLVNKETKWTLT